VAAVTTAGILAPVAGASAATTPTAGYAGLYGWTPPKFTLPQFTPGSLPAFNPGSLSFVGPSVGGLAAVIGPTVITVGTGNIFTGTTITTTGGGAIVGTGPGG
jgi:hypothetical protein